jgi:hypothetical protein
MHTSIQMCKPLVDDVCYKEILSTHVRVETLIKYFIRIIGNILQRCLNAYILTASVFQHNSFQEKLRQIKIFGIFIHCMDTMQMFQFYKLIRKQLISPLHLTNK